MQNTEHPAIDIGVLDMMGFNTYVEKVCPAKFEIQYLMDIALYLIDKANDIHQVPELRPDILQMVDGYLEGLDYDEAMARGVTDDEHRDWLALFTDEVIQCAIQVAQTLYHPLKPALKQYAAIYPSGYVIQVNQLARDGLYVDLTKIRERQPSRTVGW